MCIWDNHEFSWQGWQSILQGRRLDAARADASRSPPTRPGSNIIPARVKAPSGSLDEFGPPPVKNVKIEKFDDERPGPRAQQPRRDQQPDRLSRAALRPAPRPHPHRPAQLSRRRPVRDESASDKLGRLGRFTGCSPRTLLQVLDGGRAFNGGNPPAELAFNERDDRQSAQGRAAADDPRGRAEGLVQGPAAQLDRDLEDLGQFARHARVARRSGESSGRADQAAMAGGQLRQRAAAATTAAPGSSAARSTTWSATRRSPASRSSPATGTASGPAMPPRNLPPGKFEPVGLSFVGGSMSSPGAMEANEHAIQEGPSVAAAVPGRPAGRRRSPTGPTTCC